MFRFNRAFALVVASSAFVAARASIVYDNTTNSTGSYFAQPVEYGDEVYLAGTDRQVEHVALGIYSTDTVAETGTATLRLYGYDSGTGNPGPKLYEHSYGFTAMSGGFLYDFVVPDVIVPTDLIYTIQFGGGVSGSKVGLLIFSPPTIGTSDDAFYAYNNGSWGYYWFNGNPVANFAARIAAVPEPAPFLALGLGLVVIARRRRR